MLNELVENKIIQNEIVIELKSGKKEHWVVKNLTTSDITRRIKYIKLSETTKKIRRYSLFERAVFLT